MNKPQGTCRELVEPIYDMHMHVCWHTSGMAEDGRGDALIRDMERAGVSRGYCSHVLALSAPSRLSRDTLALARAYPDRIKGLPVPYPQYPELTKKVLKEYDKCAPFIAGFKLHPMMHRHPLSGPGYEETLAFANERSALVLVHTWGNGHIETDWPRTQMSLELCGPAPFRRVLERYPRIPFIAGHSFNGCWKEAVQLVRDFPNIYLETSTVSDRGVVEYLCEEAGSERILFGSDYPFIGMRYTKAVILAADISEADKKNIFIANAKRITNGGKLKTEN